VIGTSSTRGRAEIRVQVYSQTWKGETISGTWMYFGV